MFQMSEQKFRVLLLCTHPTQYGSPMWRLMAHRTDLGILVAYCSLEGAEPHVDPDFGVQVAWDIPLLDNYPWVKLRNISLHPVVGKFLGLINPGVWRLIRARKFDAVVMFTGYICATFWMALAAAKLSGVPILFGTDAHDISPRDDHAWKTKIKKYLWPRLFRLADVVIAPSTGTVALMRSLNIPPERVVLMPYVVHNEWWIEQAARVDRTAVRPQRSCTIFLVEGEHSLRKLTRSTLQQAGHTVLEACDAAEALDVAKRTDSPIDLLLTDVVMPGMSGRVLADELITLRPGIKVIYMSDYTDGDVATHGVLQSGISFLPKPFTGEALIGRVDEILSISVLAGR